jgi:SAM-dependent methyltransferase
MSSTLGDDLAKHEIAWRSKPLLRRIYRDWYELIAARLARIPGPTIELGAGIARFKEVVPSAVVTDVEPTPWADRVMNADHLEYADACVANLVLIDVFHHLARPARFLDEADRVLRDRGRIILLEPYCSALSTFVYTRFHHEDIDLDAAPFADDPSLDGSPMTANGARPTLAFFRHDHELRQRWTRLRLIERRRLAFFVYPLSGGFSRRSLLPVAAYRPLAHVERWLDPLGRLLAFRCLVVIEREVRTAQRPQAAHAWRSSTRPRRRDPGTTT